MDKNYSFKPRARLMSQLGEQLIKDEKIAILELIKNSYDADAKEVQVTIDNIEDREKTVVTIEDTGDGMSFYVVTNHWLEPGTNNKALKLKEMLATGKRSKLNRLPMGEKGIGRFGVHKLGDKITLITKAEGFDEVVVEIDWEEFSAEKYLDEINLSISTRKSDYKYLGKSKTGTKLIIEKSKIDWSKTRVRELNRSILSLNTPFDTIDSFSIDFKIDKSEWLKGLLKFEDIKEYSLFECDILIEGDRIKEYDYKFTPWSVLSKLSTRDKSREEISMTETVTIKKPNKKSRREQVPIDISDYEIGQIRIKLVSFDLDTRVLDLGVTDKLGLRSYLNENGGIYVCRDEIRIYEYGEKDWLGLEAGRINAPGDKLSNNLVLGRVGISRDESFDLVEKTNREGFIENEAYHEFKKAVLFAIKQFERDRAVDKAYMRQYYGKGTGFEPVIDNLALVRKQIDNSGIDKKLKKSIETSLKNIEADYKHIKDVYSRSSSMGLSMSVVLHEMDKIIAEISKVLIAENSSNRLIRLVKRLDKLTNGYSAIIKKSQMKHLDFQKLIKQSLYMVDFRLDAHEVEVIDCYSSFIDNHNIKGNGSLVVSSIINIIDNSIWWLHSARVIHKKIYIGIVRDSESEISLVFADNGKGFTLSTDVIIKPFISDKSSGGMGLGLYLVAELMEQHGGDVSFPNYNDLELPSEFSEGAIVALNFKEKK